MRFLTDFLNSGTEDQQAKKRVAALLLAITAALLAVAVIILTASSIVTAVKNKGDEIPDETVDPNAPPANYIAATLDVAHASVGKLLLIDAEHPYVGGETFISIPQTGRPQTASGSWVYSVVFDTCNGNISQETFDAFNRMAAAFYAETQDDCLYLSKAANGTFVTVEYVNVDLKQRFSIYDATTDAPVAPYTWIFEHAHEYGFVQASAVAGEENVFRYVGEVHASYMFSKNKSVSEYIELLKERTAHKPLQINLKDAAGNTLKYNVYYIAAAAQNVFVPQNPTAYEISGDNLGGYIITVDVAKLQAAVTDEPQDPTDTTAESQTDTGASEDAALG